MTTKKAHPAEPLAPEIADTEDHKTMPDGRTMRAERNRQVVVEAFSLLLKEGVAQPTAQVVADKAGVSTSTLFRLYEDLEAIHCAVLRHRFEQLQHLMVDVPLNLPLEERIRQLVTLRSKFYEQVAPVRRFVVAQRATSKYLAKGLEMNEGLFFQQIRRLFAAELGTIECREDILYSIDNLVSWESWQRLRTVQRLSVRKSKQVISSVLLRLLKQPTK